MLMSSQAGERFNASWLELSRVRFSTGKSGMQNNAGPMASLLLQPIGIVDAAPFSSVHLEEQDGRGYLAVAFGDKRREYQHASGRLLREHRRPLDRVECVGGVCKDQSVLRLVVHPGA